MRILTFKTYLSMDPETPDAESISAKFVDVRGIRRGMEKVANFRSNKANGAALGKSRRLMSSCIKAQATVIISPTQFVISTHTPTTRQKYTP